MHAGRATDERLPKESLALSMSFLDVEDVLSCGMVNRRWYSASQENQIWGVLCEALWRDKVYVPKQIRGMANGNPRQAYVESLRDARRQYPTLDELLEFSWCFRFKKSAGPHWIQIDPYWTLDHKGSSIASTIIRKFKADGSLERLDTHEAMRSFAGEAKFKWAVRETTDGDKRFVKRIQVNHFPSYVISRHSRNWGFLMQSCWVLWTSFPMPAPGIDKFLDDGHLEVRVDDQIEEVHRYNFGAHGQFGDEDDNMNRVIIQTSNGPLIVPFAQLAQHLDLFAADDDDDDDDEDDDDFNPDMADSNDDDENGGEEERKAGENGQSDMEEEDDVDEDRFPDSTAMALDRI